MVRRRAGLVLLIFVTLAAMIVPRWIGPGWPGHAELAEPGPPPVIGDCLLMRAPATEVSGDQRHPVLTSSCDGHRIGEVVAVGVQLSGALCSEKVNTYLGLGADGALVGVGPGWRPPPSFAAVLVGPTARQAERGQQWSACAVLGAASGPVSGWTGSVRLLYRGARPLAAGGCAESTFPRSTETSCAKAHQVEWFALTEILPAGSDLDRVRKECRSILRDQLGLDDPTRGGLLAVEVSTYVLGADGRVQLWWSSDRAAGASCGIRPADRAVSLTATLRGIGSNPVPLTG